MSCTRWELSMAGVAMALATASAGCRSGRAAEGAIPDSAVMQLTLAGSQLRSFFVPLLGGGIDSVIFPVDHPTILILIDDSDCLTCVNLVYEAWKLHAWIRERGGTIHGIATATDDSIVAQYARHNRLPFTFGIDSGTVLQTRFGMAAHPLVVLISPRGRVLWTVVRTAAATDRNPIDEVLADLDSAFGALPKR